MKTAHEHRPHRVIADTERSAPFKLRKASFKGKGLRPEMRDAPRDKLRDVIYKGRGA